MSVSCVGTCSTCGVKRFWLSDTLAIQLDEGSLQYLPHPAEKATCERDHGLTLGMASKRGRLYRVSFFVCRSCGKEGEVIEHDNRYLIEYPFNLPSVGTAMKWGWGSALIVIPALACMQWWQGVWVLGGTLLALPATYWWERRKAERKLPGRGLPRADAPGKSPVPFPIAPLNDDSVICQRVGARNSKKAIGTCCGKPDWIPAYRASDKDHIPCQSCPHGIMTVSEFSMH